MRRALRSLLVLYAGVLVGPVAVLAGVGSWWGIAAGAIAAGTVAVLATTGLDAPDRLLGLPVILAGFALPLGWLVVAFQRATSVSTFLLTPWFVGATAALVWFVAVAVAAEWRTQRRIDACTELIVFEARKPPTTRRQTRIAAGVVVAFSAVAFVVAIGFTDDAGMLTWLLPAQIPIWIPILAGSDGREVAIADEGVRVERQFHDWSAFDGYALTDEALSLSRPAWYHATLSFDRTDVEDLEVVTDLLDRHVDRTG